MSINVNIVNAEDAANTYDGKIKVEIVDKKEFSFIARSALNGDIMILDHKDIDIIVKQSEKKVIAFPKELMTDAAYGAESRLLEYLRNKGIIAYDSIQGGNVYGSLEGQILESSNIDEIKATLVNMSEWFDTERSYIVGTDAYDHMQDDALLDPDNAESTELGEVPAAAEKGSIKQGGLFAPYLYGRYSYE